MTKSPKKRANKPYSHRCNVHIIAILLLKTGLGSKAICRLTHGYYTIARWRSIMFHPEQLTIRQMHIVYAILEGKYSLPLLCALAAGYTYPNPPRSWYEAELPPIPPELEAQERANITSAELAKLRANQKDDA